MQVKLHEQFGLLKQKYKPKRKVSWTVHLNYGKFDIIAGDNRKGNFGTSIDFLK
jgi:hypothetical protein